MLRTLQYRITFSIYNNYESLVRQTKPKQQLIYSNFTNTTFNEFRAQCFIAPTVTVDIVAKNFNTFTCNINLINIHENDLNCLVKSKDEVLEHTGNKFIYVKVEAANLDNTLSTIFTGVELEGRISYSVNTCTFSANIVPAFYIETRGILLKVPQKTTERTVKQLIANQYNLQLHSYLKSDKQMIPQSISEYIDLPIKWLQNRYPNQYVFQVFNTLYFFDKHETNQYYALTSFKIRHRLNETNGLKFVQKLNVRLYQCECLFLSNIQIGSIVTIAPLTQQNNKITHGIITGQVRNISSTFKYSETDMHSGRTIFTLLVLNTI